MATTIAQLTLTSTDLLSDDLALSTVASISANHTTGLSRKAITATSKGASGEALLYTADDFAAPAQIYIKNTADYHASNNVIQVYDDTTSGDPVILKMAGGDWAFMPIKGDKTLKAYAPSGNNPYVEFIVYGTDQ